MPETAVTNQPTGNKRKTTLMFAIGTIIIFLLVYGGGAIALPLSVLTSYKDKNCASTIALSSFYSNIYPNVFEDKSLAGPVMECAVFTLASQAEADQDWVYSFNAYQVYESTYPNGLLAEDAHQNAASVLVNLAKEQASERKFTEALGNLNLILVKDGDIASAQVALDLFPEIYSAWGEYLRSEGKFEEAFNVFVDYKNWATNNQRGKDSKIAEMGMAQINLDWGLQLQAQKKFAEAESKFQSALSADPSLAEQINTNKEKLHLEWGDYLIEQKDFDGAMEQYGNAANLVERGDPAAAKDIIAKGYIQWAGSLTEQENFIGALVLLDFAQENAATDSIKKSADEARTNTYLAFSKSDGEQARKAMKDAVRIVCEHHIRPRLPIFGLDEGNIRAGVHGTDDQLPESIASTNPASLHYVACIEEDTRLIGTLRLPISTLVFGGPPGVVRIDYNNFQYIWNIKLRTIDGATEVETTVIEGEKPPELRLYENIIYTVFSYYGPKPDIADLVDWMQPFIK